MLLASKTAGLVLLADQISKIVVVHWLRLDQRLSIDVLPPVFNLRMAWNRGVNFGLFSSNTDLMRWALVLLAIAISVWVWIWVQREPHSKRVLVSAGLLIGGAFGNVIDRIAYGAVADFINMSCCGLSNPFSFNVADVAVFAGALGLVLFTGREKTP